ncbi:MAG: domain S-box protein [Ilumatobacteraceae bacterium]|nr:domain S-box protein [Ilumatobacteraceae bacterium]
MAVDAVEDNGNRLALLLELTGALAERMEVQEIASFVLGVGRDAVAANRGTLCLLTPDGRRLEVVGHVGYDPDMMELWDHFDVDAPLPASDAVRSRLPIYLHSPAERAARYPIFADVGGDGASVMLPLMVRGDALGALVFGFDGERDFDVDDRSFLSALGAQCAIATDRARLYDAALKREATLSMLVEVSSVLATSGADLDGALRRVAHLAAPALSDIASFHLLESAHRARLVAANLGDDQLTSPTQRVSSYGVDLQAAEGLGRVLRTGEEVVWNDGARFIDLIARDDDHRAALAAMDLGGGIILPMLARGRVLGACTFANHGSRAMSADDRQLVRTLGQRAAVLIDNARLLSQRTAISSRLQDALLPPSLPIIDGFDLGARYQPVGEGLEVGGDFYDVVRVAAGDWLFVVGDVTGHGVDAAAATGLVRHTIRSAATLGLSPSAILEHVNQALRSRTSASPAGTFCTVALAELVIPPAGTIGEAAAEPVRLIVACAGHPAPLVRHHDGTVHAVPASGRLLGFFATVESGEVVVEVEPGDTLVAFTDGVIERRGGSAWFGEHELASLIGSVDLGADALAGCICDRVTNAFPTPLVDDMAILVVRRRSSG